MTAVLDASAVLAVVFDEPGGEQVMSRLEGATMSVVNLAEVLAKHVDAGVRAAGVARDLAALGIRFEPMTVEDAELQASVRARDLASTGGRGWLSLAERACIALGMRNRPPGRHRRPVVARPRTGGRHRGDPLKAVRPRSARARRRRPRQRLA